MSCFHYSVVWKSGILAIIVSIFLHINSFMFSVLAILNRIDYKRQNIILEVWFKIKKPGRTPSLLAPYADSDDLSKLIFSNQLTNWSPDKKKMIEISRNLHQMFHPAFFYIRKFLNDLQPLTQFKRQITKWPAVHFFPKYRK